MAYYLPPFMKKVSMHLNCFHNIYIYELTYLTYKTKCNTSFRIIINISSYMNQSLIISNVDKKTSNKCQ